MAGTAAQKGAMIGMWRNDALVTETLFPWRVAAGPTGFRAVAQCAISLDFYAADVTSEA